MPKQKKNSGADTAGAANSAAPAALERLLTKREFATAVNASTRTVERWVAKGRLIPGYTPGGEMRFTQQHVDAMSGRLTPPDMSGRLTATDVTLLFGVSRGTVGNWIRQGKIEYTRTPSGRYRFEREKILQPSENGAAPRLKTKQLSPAEVDREAYLWVQRKLLKRSLVTMRFDKPAGRR